MRLDDQVRTPEQFDEWRARQAGSRPAAVFTTAAAFFTYPYA